MSQQRRASSSGDDSAVYTHLHASGHSFDIQDVHILDRDSRWLERGVKEAIWVRHEQPSLNSSGEEWNCHTAGTGSSVTFLAEWRHILYDMQYTNLRKSPQGPSQPSWRSQVAVATLIAINQVCLDVQNKDYSSFKFTQMNESLHSLIIRVNPKFLFSIPLNWFPSSTTKRLKQIIDFNCFAVGK